MWRHHSLRHDLVAEGVPWGYERGLLHTLLSHSDLVVTRETIYEGENRELSGIIY